MAILPVTNVINVTITNTPQGLSEKNVNSLALFTHETPLTSAPFIIAVSPAQVAQEYGTNSLTAKMANAVFAQVPNVRTGNGRLVVIPMLSGTTEATAGTFTTANISANLTAILAVSNGDVRITIGSTNYDLTNLNFTNATTLADVAAILDGALTDADVVATVDGFEITAHTVGTASTVAMAAVPSGTGTALNGSGFFNAAGGTAASGANSTGETLLEAIARTDGAVGYVPVMTTMSLEDAEVLANAAGIQAMDKMYHVGFASTANIAGAVTTIQQSGYTKTRPKVYTEGIEQSKLMNAAYAGRGHSVNFTGSLTSQTMNLKQLASITPDTGITQTLYEAAKIAGADLYVSYDGVPSVLSTGANDYFDNVYSDLALKFALETAGFNFLRQTNTKVPQTESGMNGLKAAYSNVCDRFVRNGCIAAGSWTSSERFGDPQIFDNNILTRGYYVYSLPIVQQSSVEREERKAPLVQIAVKRAGAIHTSDVIVLVND